MHLFIVEGLPVEAELRRKFGPAHTYDFCPAAAPDLHARLGAADVAFDLRSWPELHYEQLRQPVFYDTTARSLAQLFHEEKPPLGPVFGFCGLPTLIDRRLLETSLLYAADADKLAEVCAALGTEFRTVQDRVGLVTPRIICMIINEACYTLQEGTASVRDIDLGMKLGTNYPHGPFEWANAIGLARVYETLECLYQDTHEERYKVCPLLKTMYLRGQQFEV
ncbi:3-hydroxyacyl-CoA dehydrogenase family protein [Hymenobacter weizhouensis]|uniref:3-hydroxyacyl-CoA dehydrogenase family protein n=1 Tax=Hymenobacter sp. YIM 151500-1 TaxID=2987689 RepID=UPI002227A90C|nr:3-hydroxyacyl-CoA dehydrogenase family protein [Hymenobacter sp. YIM 151500-1]UYZ62199.1 3-hydroxyacyl-CoA dehydrogenase family protein [Hymenobacter sp. YIM 151500-1]